jgi:hypothetical protein
MTGPKHTNPSIQPIFASIYESCAPYARSTARWNSNGPADGTANGLLDFDGPADGKLEGSLDFDGTEDGIDDGSLDLDGINKGKVNSLLDSWDGPADGTDKGSFDFDGSADGKLEGLLDFDGTEDGIGDGAPDSDGIDKGKICWMNIVSTLLLLGICSLNVLLLAHSVAVNTSHRSYGYYKPGHTSPRCIRSGYLEKVRKAHFLPLFISRISSHSIVSQPIS